MSAFGRQRQLELNIGKKFVKFGNEAHFMSFAAIVAFRSGTDCSNLPHIFSLL